MITIEEILERVKKYNPNANLDMIRKAYETAKKVHENEKRASGEPYIIHPLAVAYYLTDFELDDKSICAALLHDVVESGYSLELIRTNFDDEIASLVDGLTKMTELREKGRETYQVESIRKMLVATTKDLRIIIIKLLDKLHNMRTLQYLPPETQKRIAKEVMDIYAPIAYRLGIEKIKRELEDLAFKYLEPEKFKEIDEKIQKNKKTTIENVERLRTILEKELHKQGIDCRVVGRLKSHFSIYKKMIKKNRPFEEIFDVVALRVITKSVEDCYKVVGIIHSMWKPIPKHFKDYIAMPKSNFYQSLHDIVIGPEGTIVEIQIRTDEMDRIAEVGIAGHWKYKGIVTDEKFDRKLSWIRQLIDWQNEVKSGKELVELLEVDFFEDQIYVFTPKGKVIELPKGSTPIDFAYAIHSDIGNHAFGAKVNGTFTTLRQELRTGDVVEIITSKKQTPKPDWLKIVKTVKARERIRKYLQEHGKIPPKIKKSETREEADLRKQTLISVSKIKNPTIKLALCCHPLPGDSIIGFASKTKKVTIHKTDCDQIKNLTKGPKRKVEAKWQNNFSSLVELKVEAVDRVGLFADILNTIAATGTNVERANAKAIGSEMAECSFRIRFEDLDHMRDLTDRIKRVKGVKKIYIGKLSI